MNMILKNTKQILNNSIIHYIQPTRLVFSNTYNSSIKDKIRQERLDRLQREKEYFPTKTSDDVNQIRNVGIIAHIDAGKTTTTERMLYYAGALDAPGEVHDGTTVMDYMDQERERGITIRSAAISFNWRGYQFNLIDTPGHIDFSGEVERSLRILDGAVAIFDGVSGVETQSEMVWYQSNKFKIPRLVFINKMDRAGASLEATLASIQQRLNVEPMVLQVPIGEAETFSGIIDVINLLEIKYVDSYGNDVQVQPLQKDNKYYDKVLKYREQLLDTLSLYDEQLTDKILNGEEINSEFIENSIKNVLQKHSKEICPVFVGSSLKNKGVQLLMDAIIKYLPSPQTETEIVSIKNEFLNRKQNKNEKLTALAYKIINDPEKGPLTYVRVYSGVLKARQLVRNVNRQINEKSSQLFRVRASDYVSIKEICAGDIAAIQGLKECQAGNTLLDENDLEDFVMEELKMPQPVFMASIQYESLKDKTPLEQALTTIAKEDTSFQFVEDKETGQLIGKGLGELHLEVIRDRIEQEFNIKATLGKMKVTYREGVQDSFEISYTFQKLIANKPIYVHLDLSIEPIELEEEEETLTEKFTKTNKKKKTLRNEIKVDFEREPEFDIYYREFKRRQLVINRGKQEQTSEEIYQDDMDIINSPVVESLQNLKFIKNPTKHQEAGQLQDEYGEETLHHISSLSFDYLYKLEKTIKNGLMKGSLLNYPMLGVRVKILDGKFTLKRTNEIAIEQAASEMLDEMIRNASPILLEPVMDVEISTPNTNQKDIMNNVIKGRRGKVIQIEEEKSKFGQISSERTQISAEIPLIETVGYSSYLRSISKGDASFIMKFKKFDYVGSQKQKELLDGSSF